MKTYQNKHAKNYQNPNNKAFLFFLTSLFTLAWPHGGELIWELLPFSITIFILVLTCLLSKQPNTNQLSSIKKNLQLCTAPLCLLISWLVYSFFQLVPLPAELVSVLSPKRVELCESYSIIKNSCHDYIPITVSFNHTLMEFLKFATYIGSFILTLMLLTNKKRLLSIVKVLFFSSAIMAIYSLINHSTNGSISLLDSIPPWTIGWDQATHGTFSYQNHYASFLTMTIPIGVALAYMEVKKNLYQGSLVRNCLQLMLSKTSVYAVLSVLMIIALVKTSSRGGSLFFVIGILFTILCIFVYTPNKSVWEKSKQALVTLLTGVVLVMIIGASGIMDSLIERFSDEGLSPNYRNFMHETSLKIISEFPILGSGAGTYPILQHKYKLPELGPSEMSKRAHNDYLEFIANHGVIGTILLGLAMVLIAKLVFRNIHTHNTNGLIPLKFAIICSVTTISLHSMTDFNFQLPVNAVYFFVLLGVYLSADNVNR